MTETISQLSVRFPSDDDDEPAASQDTEWCEVVADGETHRIRFHDYHEIYDIPGLYERIFHDHLKCRSPEVVIGLLQEQLEAAGADPSGLTALDVDERARVSAGPPNVMTTVAAPGFDDIPPRAFAEAYNVAAEGAWVAFNLKADFLERVDESGVRGLIRRMAREEIFEQAVARRYVHRLSIAGERREDASGAASWVAERAGDGAYVDEKCEEVRRSIQHGMDALARRRVFPVFG